MLNLYGGQDGDPAPTVNEMKRLPQQPAEPCRQGTPNLWCVPSGPHAPMLTIGPAPQDAAEDGWKQLLRWFKARRCLIGRRRPSGNRPPLGAVL